MASVVASVESTGESERERRVGGEGHIPLLSLEHDCDEVAKSIQIIMDLFSILLLIFSPKSPTSARHSPSVDYPPRGSRRI